MSHYFRCQRHASQANQRRIYLTRTLQYGPGLDAVIGMIHQIIKTQIAGLVHYVAGDISLRRHLVSDLAVHDAEPLVQLDHLAERQLVKRQANPTNKQSCTQRNITSKIQVQYP